ncbi:hypothetical protein [Stratiformator vulcanicus]|nr:hypothetical protein [Stratiformator vulcanicus]
MRDQTFCTFLQSRISKSAMMAWDWYFKRGDQEADIAHWAIDAY